MINFELVKDYLQNKNFIMCITSVFFMLGVLSYFGGKEILMSVILTVVLVFLLSIKIFSVKRAVLLALVFYC